MPYYRFCQIIETISRRLFNGLKREIEIKEVIAKFQTEVFALGSYLSKRGKEEVLNRIDEFSILKKDKDKKGDRKEEKKLPKVGSFERLMGIFGGGKK